MSVFSTTQVLDAILERSAQLQAGQGYYYLTPHYPVVDAALRAAVNKKSLFTSEQMQYVSDLAIEIAMAGDTALLTSRMRVLDLALFMNSCGR